MSRFPPSYPLAGGAAALALLPVGVLAWLAAGAETLWPAHALDVLINTTALTALTVLGTVLLGVPLALVTAYVQMPLQRFWLVLLAAPLAMPSYVGAFTFYAAFGPGGEIEGLTGLATPSLRGLAGAALVMTLYTFPFVLLTTRASLRGLDPSVLDAARLLGLSVPGGLLRVVLPRARNGIAAGALLVALYTLSDFGTPAIMGLDTFTRVIFIEYNAFGLGQAAVLSLHLLAIVCLVLYLETRVGTEQERPGRILNLPLAPGRQAAIGTAMVAVATLALGVPLAVLGIWLAREGIGGFEPVIAWNSAYVAILTALVTAALAVPVAFAAMAGALGRVMERITYLGFGVPGIVMGTALVYVGLQITSLYQTLALLIVAYALRFVPLAVGAIRSNVERLDPNLVQAAQLLGAGRAEAFRRISLPLSARGAITGAALVFLETMRELPATLLLRPTGFETLATYLWQVYEAGYFGHGAVPGLLLILISGIGLVIMLTGERRTDTGLFAND